MAKIETMLLYQVITNSDRTEGRGKTVSLGWYDNETEAHRAAKGKGLMGSDAEVRPYDKQVVLTSTPEIYLLGERVLDTYRSPDDIRREDILAKLTPEERRILGV